MNNINNNTLTSKPDPSHSIKAYSPFDFIPVEIQHEILSFANSKSLGNVTQVCTVFNGLVNSGNIEGKNVREYLLNKLNKIDFEYTREDLYSLIETVFSSKKPVPLLELELEDWDFYPDLNKPEDCKKFEDFKKDFLNFVSDNLSKIETNKIEVFKQAAINNIIEVKSKDAEIKNIQLVEFIQNATNKESQEFIKALAQKILLNFFKNKTPNELKKMNLTQFIDVPSLPNFVG
ncbi:MAG: hypothetical protein K1000chlam3_00794 [Chlamydiae bacterium]|nr:hypothetical protein [Chlamydiota bacterium]